MKNKKDIKELKISLLKEPTKRSKIRREIAKILVSTKAEESKK